MPFDASKVERTRWVDYGYEGYAPWPEDGTNDDIRGAYPKNMRITVSASDFDACAAALDEARAEGIVREYQSSAKAHWPCGNGQEQCFLCKRADEALGGK